MKHVGALLCFSLTYVALSPLLVLAQFNIPGITDRISLSVIPETPTAFETTTITAISYNLDLSRARISWYVNGALADSGIGKKTFAFTTGDVGETTTIRVVMDSMEGIHTERIYAITPSNVELAWEALTYTPPFYKGKALFTTQSGIRIVALPDFRDDSGAYIPPESLIYQWKINNKPQSDQSGYGKSTLTLPETSVLESTFTVEVDVSDISNTSHTVKSLALQSTQPFMRIYTIDPLIGLDLGHSVKAPFSFEDKEVVFYAVPYFYSTPTASDYSMNYAWYINGTKTLTGDKNILTVRKTNAAGRGTIGLKSYQISKRLQSSQISFDVTLTKSTPPTNF